MLEHRDDLVLAAHKVGGLGYVALQVDGVKHAPGGAQAAADAAVGVDDAHAAAEAAAGLGLDLLLGEGEAVMLEGAGLALVMQDGLAGRAVEAVHAEDNVVLVKLVELAQVAAAGQALAVVDKAVQGLGTLSSGGTGRRGRCPSCRS